MGAVAITGLTIGLSTLAFASPVSALQGSALQDGYHGTLQTSHIVRADYWYNHHRYHHRRWDRQHKRWDYY
jgi:hypothetical protein